MAGTDQTSPSPRLRALPLQLAVGLLAAIVVLTATRDDPMLSPDSITYLSAAESLRDLDGFVDFTGEPLTHFPPVFPVLLTLGGRSLVWASIVGAACAAVAAALFAGLLWSRVRPGVAVVGSTAFVLSQAVVRVESTVWSETPYAALSLLTLTVLNRPEVTLRRSAAAGAVAGIGFLTRYAGAGLVATGLVVVAVGAADGGRRAVLRNSVAYLGPAGVLASAWVIRNLVATGEPLGPHFEGGAGESPTALVEQVVTALGRLVTDVDTVGDLTKPAGYLVLAGVLVAAAITFLRRPVDLLDVAMATFALTSIIVPTVSRAFTGTHIESRIMFPALIPVVYFAVVAVNRLNGDRALLGAALVGAVLWSFQGANAARDAPDRLGGSAGNPESFSPRLYDLVEDLPDDVSVLTNSPQRVWWHTGHFPIRLAFTRPQPGNSHFPLSPADTVAAVCEGDTYLAWFSGLDNTRGVGPAELRPDLAELVDLNTVDVVPGGTLYRLAVADRGDCDG